MSGKTDINHGRNEKKTVRRSFAAHIFSPIKITRNQFIDLMVPFRHSLHIRHHAAAVIVSRIQLMSAIFGVLLPLFSIVDWLVLLLRNGSTQGRFPSAMFPLGISKRLDVTSAAVNVSLEKRDHLYIFSDGIIEAKDSNGNMFGMIRLETFLEKVVTGEHVLDDLIALLDNYVGSSIHDDDISLVEVQI